MITFQVHGVPDAFRGRTALRRWLERVARLHARRIDHITYVLMDERRLLQYNRAYLHHDDHTDVIAFQADSDHGISGDILISYDRVRENAHLYGVRSRDELHRVMVHGLLHLCGLRDGTKAGKATMRRLEDRYLALR
jgi:rRNA maturation RNase YbeY